MGVPAAANRSLNDSNTLRDGGATSRDIAEPTLDRREFLQTSAAGLAGATMLSFSGNPAFAESRPAVSEPWYRRAYRRNVIDMHITDWNEAFLSEFDAPTYVEMLRKAQVQSAVVYAHSHVGLCYFPTKVGRTHRAYQGRNLLGDVIDRCHANGIAVVLYYSVIFDRWAYDNDSDWQMKRTDGNGYSEHSRHGLCCPNSPYRNHVVTLTEEICDRYDFEGIRFDMMFWPAVCYCRYCAKRFDAEVGGELPKVVNWEDPRWVGFQRKREQWLVEFARLLKTTVKRHKPNASVEHQASTYTANWRLGVTESLADQNDFLQGDFYGDALQGSFVRKLFYNLSPDLPYGFETSVMSSLRNHTRIKSKALLRAKAYACVADGGAFVFIDSIDPIGTLNTAVYETMGEVFDETKVYEAHLGGTMRQDVAVYLSTESKFSFDQNGKDVNDTSADHTPHVDGAVSACKSLIDDHIPYGVITKKGLARLSRHRVLVLPNVLMMDREEIDVIRNYVRSGGTLYASKYTSLVTKDGRRHPDFLLGDLFGIAYVDETKECYTYVAPTAVAGNLLSPYSRKRPLGLDSTQLIVKPRAGAKILGKMGLPYTDPADHKRYASIHSNPPGKRTDDPTIVSNRFGKGKVIYVSGELEASDLYRRVFINLIRSLFNRFSFEADAPRSVEVTVFHQRDRRRFLINLVNFQKELPNIPVNDVTVRVRLEHETPKRLSVVPGGKELTFRQKGDLVEFTAPRLETFLMLALDYT